jgi:hypothetical protein
MLRLLQSKRIERSVPPRDGTGSDGDQHHYDRALVAYIRRAAVNAAISESRRLPKLLTSPPQYFSQVGLQSPTGQDETELELSRRNDLAGALLQELWERTRSECTAAQQDVMDTILADPGLYGHDGTIPGAVDCLLRFIDGSFSRQPGERKRLSRLICKTLNINTNTLDQRKNRIRSAWIKSTSDMRPTYNSSELGSSIRSRRNAARAE